MAKNHAKKAAAERPATPPPATKEPASVPVSPKQISATVEHLVEAASPYLAPIVQRAKSNLSAELVEKLESAASTAQVYSQHVLDQADGMAAKLTEMRSRTPDIMGKAHEGSEFVKGKVAKGEEFVLNKVKEYGLPTSFAELKEMGSEQVEKLKGAAIKLREALPEKIAGIVPEEQIARIRGALSKVLEALPKIPTFELPKLDLSKFKTEELIKVPTSRFHIAHSTSNVLFSQYANTLLARLSPLLEPYQTRVHKLLTDYKLTDRATALQQKAVDLYKAYGVDRVVPRFMSGLVLGGGAEVAAQ